MWLLSHKLISYVANKDVMCWPSCDHAGERVAHSLHLKHMSDWQQACDWLTTTCRDEDEEQEEVEEEDDIYRPPPAGGRRDEAGKELPVQIKMQVRFGGGVLRYSVKKWLLFLY